MNFAVIFWKKIGFFKNFGSKLKFGLKKTIKIAIPFTVLRIGKIKWSNCNFFKKPVKKDLIIKSWFTISL